MNRKVNRGSWGRVKRKVNRSTPWGSGAKSESTCLELFPKVGLGFGRFDFNSFRFKLAIRVQLIWLLPIHFQFNLIRFSIHFQLTFRFTFFPHFCGSLHLFSIPSAVPSLCARPQAMLYASPCQMSSPESRENAFGRLYKNYYNNNNKNFSIERCASVLCA